MVEFSLQREKLLHTLAGAWNDNIFIEEQQKGNKSACLIIKSGLTDNKLTNLVKALNYMGELERQLKKLGNKIMENLFLPVMNRTTSVIVEEVDDTMLKLLTEDGDLPEVSTVFDNLTAIMRFLLDSLMYVKIDEDLNLMQLFGQDFGNVLCEALVRDVLSPAVPALPGMLDEYKAVQGKSDDFQSILIEIGKFLTCYTN